MKRTFTAILFAIVINLTASAVPARPGQWRTLRLADGTEVRAQLMGDEHLHYWQTQDGRSYVLHNGSYEQANLAELAQQAAERRARAQAPRLGANGAPKKAITTGQHKGIVILAQYADKDFKAAHTREYFEQFINVPGYTDANGFRGSVRDYFYEQSGGQFELNFDVIGPVTLDHNYAYYGGDYNEDYRDQRAQEMIREACQKADAQFDVNFADYDWDGDGEVEEVFVVYAGKGQADGGDDDTIWPHKSAIWGNLWLDNVRIRTYACGSELNGSGIIDGIGTICHEYSHCLGLPDLYDTQYGGNYGMGTWDLMDSGCYNGGGFVPSGYCAASKLMIGWQQPVELTDEVSVTAMKAMSEGGDFYRITNAAHTDEYYLLENRQRTGWDAGLYGNGLLVTHVDYNATFWEYNVVNSNAYGNNHPRCQVVPADNSTAISYQGIIGDTYPYGYQDALTTETTPATTLFNNGIYDERLLYVEVTDIVRNNDGTMAFNFRPVAPEVVDTNDALFYESFNQCAGKGGTENTYSGVGIGTAAFLPDNEGWTADKAHGADRCAMFGSSSVRGTVTTPKIGVTGEADLWFRVAMWKGEGEKMLLSVNDGFELTDTEIDAPAGKWTKVHTTLRGTGYAQITFTPQKRFFLDEVIVKGEGYDGPDPDGILNVRSNTMPDGRIYTLDGRCVGTDVQQLPHGIYIRNGKKVVR